MAVKFAVNHASMLEDTATLLADTFTTEYQLGLRSSNGVTLIEEFVRVPVTCSVCVVLLCVRSLYTTVVHAEHGLRDFDVQGMSWRVRR